MRDVDAKSSGSDLIYEGASLSVGEGEVVENACLENGMEQMVSRMKSRSQKKLGQPLSRMMIRVLRLPGRRASLGVIC